MCSYRNTFEADVIRLIKDIHIQTWKACNVDWVNLSKRGGKDGVFRGVALPARGKPRPPRLFYSELHSISSTVFQSTEVSRRVNFFNAILVCF